MKRVIDVVFAAAWLLITAPLIILVAILIRLESKGAVFLLASYGWISGKAIFSLSLSDNVPKDTGSQIGARADARGCAHTQLFT